ncbi:MAG TPA: hypothetical protein VK668_07925 [Mucilaginibacter sp.]|nr:hypothetical protein [Mucilaginibacter sp.]
MKNLITGLALLSMLSMFSCTHVLYSHDDVLNKYQTKQDIAKQFGVPAEKKMGETSEEWLYIFSSKTLISPHLATADVTVLGKYKRYIIFTMDLQGNVVRWYSEGVNFEVRKSAPGETIALIVGIVAVITVGAIAASHITFDAGPIL